MRKLLNWMCFATLGILLSGLTGCGGGSDGPNFVGPGLVGIDDRPVTLTAPLLTVKYALPATPGTFEVDIFSDQPTDGDIAFDPVLAEFTITQGPDTLLLGIDSAASNQPEFRAFLDFPLDGSTEQPEIPLEATIISATLTIFVEFVDFAATVPVILDLVEYSVIDGLAPGDFSSIPLAGLAFDISNFEAGQDIFIDVTSLMTEVQFLGLADFQVRLLLGP